MAQSLPDCTGNFGRMRSSWGVYTYATGPFSITSDGNSIEWGGSGSTTVYRVTFSLSNGNSIYRSGNKVTPSSTSVKYFIKY